MADPGTHGGIEVDDELGWAARWIGLGISCIGIFFLTVIIGLVAQVIREKMDSLKKVPHHTPRHCATSMHSFSVH